MADGAPLTPGDLLADIVEVHTFGARRASVYLQRGYRLLGIYAVTEGAKHASGAEYVQRQVIFVIGRPRDVEHYEEPPRRPPEPAPTEL